MKQLLILLGIMTLFLFSCGENAKVAYEDTPVHSPADEVPVAQPAATLSDVKAEAGTESAQGIRTTEEDGALPANEVKNKQSPEGKTPASRENRQEADSKVANQKSPETKTAAKKKIANPPAKSAQRGRPKVAFQETVHEFGVIAQGEKVEHSFVFENVGDADLEILNVDVTCGCTIPTFPFIPIAPGEKGKIMVSYNSTGKLGSQKPMITVITNASPRTYKLYFKGVVDAERAKLQPDGSEEN